MEKENHSLSQGNGPSIAISEFSEDKEASMAEVVARYLETLTHSKTHMLGFPANLDFDYSILAPLLQFFINNIGNPFTGSTFVFNSRAFELTVLDWFAQLWEIEKNQYWGYITTGGTEGNLHGILVGRELFPDGILYTSEESHESMFKVARMYRMERVKVGSLVSGEINCADFKALLLAHRDKPAIININIGTTMKGAMDDLDLVLRTLEECGFTRDGFYVHCDGALNGIMLPLLKGPIGSITISGHMFLGCPFPCGVAITRLHHINILSKTVEYIATVDAIVTGSRTGHAPIFLWYALNKKGLVGLKQEAESCIEKAKYLKHQLRSAGITVMLNEFSITVLFERPLDDGFAHRWNLVCKGLTARVVVMQHVSIEMLDAFVRELVSKRTVWYPGGQSPQPPCLADDIGAANCACALHK